MVSIRNAKLRQSLTCTRHSSKAFTGLSGRDMHPTLQQSLYRLIRECIKVMADDNRRYDDRNRASHEEAKCIMEYLNERGRNIPLR